MLIQVIHLCLHIELRLKHHLSSLDWIRRDLFSLSLMTLVARCGYAYSHVLSPQLVTWLWFRIIQLCLILRHFKTFLRFIGCPDFSCLIMLPSSMLLIDCLGKFMRIWCSVSFYDVVICYLCHKYIVTIGSLVDWSICVLYIRSPQDLLTFKRTRNYFLY